MGLLDILANEAMGLDVPALAAKVGLKIDVTEAVLAALGKAHFDRQEPVDTAVAETGVPRDKVEALLAAIGGEDALAKVAGLISGGGVDDPLGKK